MFKNVRTDVLTTQAPTLEHTDMLLPSPAAATRQMLCQSLNGWQAVLGLDALIHWNKIEKAARCSSLR